MELSVVLGFWQDRPPLEVVETALLADRLGFPGLWVGEMATFDAFALATAIGLQTQQIELTVGPLAVAVRTPMTMAMGAASVAALTGRAVRLAIGTSSEVVVEEWHGRRRRRPARHLDEAAAAVSSLLAGERAEVAGELVQVRGYRLRLDAPGAGLTVAAFGDGAVKVAGRRADRMVLNMVTPEAAARFREQLDRAAADAGRAAPRLAVWLATAVDPTDDARAQIARAKVSYLAAPGYRDMFREAGFGGAVDVALGRPHPREVLAAITPELVSSVGLVGDVATIDQRMAAYEQAGIDEICIVPATAGDPAGKRTLEALAPRARPPR